ncbi:MAG TPA: lipid biosynthesis B12-binding/radical SAM protein [Bacteroidales bacterium]|nr:lipid biosynthesis B12-binding/radical SAM protein [Bacteroidales bacterium]
MNGKKKNILIASLNTLTVPYPVYPIGISYLSTYIEQKLPDYQVTLFDFNLSNPEDFLRTLEQLSPQYIGFSIRNIDGANSYDPTNFIKGYKTIIDFLRKNYHSDYKVFLGGAGFSIFPQAMFSLLKPDYAVVGEGEESLVELITNLDAGKPVDHIGGLVYEKNGAIVVNNKKLHPADLQLCFDKNLIDFYWYHSGMLNIQTKRGCPFNCVYCTYPVIEGRIVRTLNTDLIVENISKLYRDKGIDYIFFTDSVFNMKNDYNIELAEKIIRSGIKIRWGAYFYPKGLNKEILQLFKTSGLTHIEFGTESISQHVLQCYGKHFTVDDIIQQSELCNMVDVPFAHFMILAGYGETDKTINETFENSKKIKNTVFFPFVGMRIYPGTKLYEIAVNENIIDKNDLLLEPRYFISKEVNTATLKDRAKNTGRRWVFPDEDTAAITNKMRTLRNKKGPLWEYLIQ